MCTFKVEHKLNICSLCLREKQRLTFEHEAMDIMGENLRTAMAEDQQLLLILEKSITII